MKHTFVALSLFANGFHASPLLHSARDVATVAGYQSEGCYTEAANMRALTGKDYFDDAMTVEKCAAACSGFTWFGVEYGRECYCGNTINPGSEPTAQSDCSFSCPGHTSEDCGAGNRLNMYSKISTTSSTSSSAVSQPTAATYLGCYAEPDGSRALSSKTLRDDTMTVELCAKTCSGYALFGVEYYNECYCGNSLTQGSVEAPPTDCKYKCSGNPDEICGGDLRLNVYQLGDAPSSSTSAAPTPLPTAYSFDGCYTEATNQRALSLKSYYDDAMTVEICAAQCKGYTWFGLEYGRECYCGNTINRGSAKTLLSECSFPCPGDNTESCGAGDRLDMFQYGAATSSSSSTTSTTSSSASPTTTESSSSSPPASSSSSSSTTPEPSSSFSSSVTSTSTVLSSQTTSAVESSSFTTTTTSTTTTTFVESSSSTTTTTTTTSAVCTLPTNPVLNGNFEGIDISMYKTTGNGVFQVGAAGSIGTTSGTRVARMFVTSAANIVTAYQTVAVCPGFTYNFSINTKRTTTYQGLTCQLTFKLGDIYITQTTLPTTAGDANYSQYWPSVGKVVPTTSSAQLSMTLNCVGSIGSGVGLGMYLDDLVLTRA